MKVITLNLLHVFSILCKVGGGKQENQDEEQGYCSKKKTFDFQIKILPFLNLENARNFYITVKEYFSDDEFANF